MLQRNRVVLFVILIVALFFVFKFFETRAKQQAKEVAELWSLVHAADGLTVYRTRDVGAQSYLLVVDKKGILIDASIGPGSIDDKFPVQVEAVLLTHAHRDSCAAVGMWLTAKVPVRAAKDAEPWLGHAGVAKFWKDSIPLRSSDTRYFVVPEGYDGIDFSLADGTTIEFGGFQIRVIATPGHSPDHLAFAVSKADADPIVFCGDAVMGGRKLWTPYTTDWDHWTDKGLKPAAESLRKLAKLKPVAVFPAHGTVLKTNAAETLDRAAQDVDEVGFLKSFERFTNRLGNPPQYDFLVPKDQVGSGGDKPWSKVSDHLWITGNTYVLASRDKTACLVLDPWGDRSVKQVEKLRQAEKLGPIEVVVFSHAHYDHFDGVYTLPGREAYKVWSLDTVAAPLREPFRFRAPFLDARPITFDKVLKDTESATWREYTFRFHELPGQTAYTCGIETTIDGKRCYFTADNFFHQNQYSGSGGWMGLNSSSPAVYAKSAQKVLDAAPDWVLAEHGGPYQFSAEDYRRRVQWGEAAAKAANVICPTNQHRNDWNPHHVSIEPIRIEAKPGETIEATVRLLNLSLNRPGYAHVTLQGRGLIPTQSWKLETGALGGTTEQVRIRLPDDLPAGRHVFAVVPLDVVGREFADPFLAIDVLK